MSHDTVIVYEDGPFEDDRTRITYAINWAILIKQKFIKVTKDDGSLITVAVNPSHEKILKLEESFYVNPVFKEIDAADYVSHIEKTEYIDIDTAVALGGLLEIKREIL